MVLILAILLTSLVLVIGSIFGRSWKFSMELCWWRSRDVAAKKKKSTADDKYTAVSARDILKLLNETQVFPLCWNRGWALRHSRNGCQTWRRRHRNDVMTGGHVTGATTVVRASPKICVDQLRSLSHLKDWDQSVLSHAYLQQCPPTAATPPTDPPRPDWDIVRLTEKWAGLVGWWAWFDIIKEAWLYRWVENKWCSNAAVYQRFWFEEDNGVYWFLRTCVDRSDWCFYLAQPSKDEHHCLLSVLRCQPDSWLTSAGSALVSHALTSHLQSFRTFIHAYTTHPIHVEKFTLPHAKKTESPKQRKDRSSDRPRTLQVSKSHRSTSLCIENNEKCAQSKSLDLFVAEEKRRSVEDVMITTHAAVEQGVVTYQNSLQELDSGRSFEERSLGENGRNEGECKERSGSGSGRSSPYRTPSPVVPSSPRNESSTRSSPVRSCSTPKHGPRLTRASTLHEDFTACREQKVTDWVDATTITQSHNYSTQTLGLACDSQYKTCSNHCAAQIITELTYASNLDLSLKPEDQAKTTCGWTFSHTEKDVLILKKHTKTTNSGIYSFIGKGIVQSSPRAVWEAVRNPHTRFTYDESMKKMEILHDFGGGLKFTCTTRLILCLRKRHVTSVYYMERMDGDRYILTISSIDWLPCPVKADTVRGQFLSSGWVVEPTFQDGRLSAMVTYLSQMNLKTTSSHFVDEIASRQPSAIAQLRQFLTPRVRRGSRTPSVASPSAASVVTRISNGKDTESGRSSS